jgi:UDP-N-acetylglucosamine 2-epimerase (non-hydrolysing)
MLIFVLGTTAEVIKTAAVLNLLTEGGFSYKVISTEQHPKAVKKCLESFECDVSEFQVLENSAKGIAKMRDVPFWFLRSLAKLFWIFKRQDAQTVIVHGDTLTTLIGALAGNFSRKKVVHLEAGYRSNVWHSPFPEEIVRRIVSRLSTYHLAPGLREVSNLTSRNIPGSQIACTILNTGLDHLAKILSETSILESSKTKILITLHRSENLESRKWLAQTVNEISILAKAHEIVFVTDDRSFGVFQKTILFKSPSITFLPKQEYGDFLNLILNSKCVITDSGGLQQECAQIGIPTLVHRKHTESSDGLGRNVILSENKAGSLVNFVASAENFRMQREVSTLSPSVLAVTALKKWGLLGHL